MKTVTYVERLEDLLGRIINSEPTDYCDILHEESCVFCGQRRGVDDISPIEHLGTCPIVEGRRLLELEEKGI